MAKSSEEIHFARLLVNPDKSIRDKTLASVKRFIVRHEESESMGLLEMLKLWKALYYSLWLADSGNQADELAESIADLIIKLAKKPDSLTLFFSCLLKTVLREWSLLDQHRINKFYFLLRRSINKILSVCIELLSEKSSKKLNEKKKLVSQLLAALQEEALSHVPNGVRFHIADVFIPELVNVVRSNDGQLSLTTEIFMVLVAPFLQVLTTSPDPVFRERVYKAVFRTFLSIRGGAGGGTGEQESAVALEGVDARELQRKVFSLASAEDTVAGCRQRLYDLHKEIAAKTGVAFVSEDAPLAAAAAPVDHATEQQQQQQQEEQQQGKKSKSKAAVVEVAAAQEEKIDEEKGKEMEKEKEKAAVVKTTKVKRSAPTEPSTSALPSSSQDGSSKKAKTEPVRDPDLSPGKAEEAAADFFASKKFTGSKEGFVFQKGPQGVGYYRDHPPQASKKTSNQKQAQSQSAGKRRR